MIELLIGLMFYSPNALDFSTLAKREVVAIEAGDYVHHECDQLACCDSFYDEETDNQ